MSSSEGTMNHGGSLVELAHCRLGVRPVGEDFVARAPIGSISDVEVDKILKARSLKIEKDITSRNSRSQARGWCFACTWTNNASTRQRSAETEERRPSSTLIHTGIASDAISSACRYAFVVRPECVDIVPLAEAEAVWLRFGEQEVSALRLVVDARYTGCLSDTRGAYKSGAVREFYQPISAWTCVSIFFKNRKCSTIP